METVICRCGKQFNVYSYRIKRSKELFCSKKCKTLYCKPLLGKKRGYDTITKIRDAQIGIKKSSESIIAMRKNQPNRSGTNNSFYGKQHSEETKKKISDSRKGHKQSAETIAKRRIKISGENHYNWQGGLSKTFHYLASFNKQFKEKIKKRDDYICAVCMKKTSLLDCHHIDYDKLNNSENNIIALCKSCHTKTNYNRSEWIVYLQERMNFDVWIGGELNE